MWIQLLWKWVTPGISASLCCSFSLSHSTSCSCLLNNRVVLRRTRAAQGLTGRDEKSSLAVKPQTPVWPRWMLEGQRASVCEGMQSVRVCNLWGINRINHPSNDQEQQIKPSRDFTHDVIENYSSATTKCSSGRRSERLREHRRRTNDYPVTGNKSPHIQLTGMPK